MESLVSDNKLLDKSCWWRYGKGPFYWEVLIWVDSILTACVCFGLKITWLDVLWFKTYCHNSQMNIRSFLSGIKYFRRLFFVPFWLTMVVGWIEEFLSYFCVYCIFMVFVSWFMPWTFLVQNLGCGQPCCGGKKCFISTSIVYKMCTVICANDVRSENIKQAKWNGCPYYRCTDQNMFCPHPIPFPSVILLPSSSLEPDFLCFVKQPHVTIIL